MDDAYRIRIAQLRIPFVYGNQDATLRGSLEQNRIERADRHAFAVGVIEQSLQTIFDLLRIEGLERVVVTLAVG